HRAAWPTEADIPTPPAGPGLLEDAATVLAGIRGAKSTAKVSMRADVASVTVTGPADQLGLVVQAMDDLKAAGRVVGDIALPPSDAPALAASAEVIPPTA